MKVHFETFGCSANQNDSEIMAGMLQEQGHQISSALDQADAIVVNTCTVKGKTEAHIKSMLKRVRAQHPAKKLVVAGCMAEAQTFMVKELVPEASLVGPHRLKDIVRAIDDDISATGYDESYKVQIPKINLNPHIAIIQINDGCASCCTFCITKIAKPRLISYPIGLIAHEAEAAIASGMREIWITSQDTGAYGLDRRTNLAQLLRVLTSIDGDFRIRIGMMNPQKIIPFVDDLVDVYKSEKIFKFLHIPIQSGNDEVLRHMRRGHTVKTYMDIIGKFRSEIPSISLSTDIICGYPTETREQFQDTLDLIRKIRPDTVNISRFSSRPGTAAATLGAHSDTELKFRSRQLSALVRQIARGNNDGWVGWQGPVFFSEKGSRGGIVGRNLSYKPIVLRERDGLLGSQAEVVIESATGMTLRAALMHA